MEVIFCYKIQIEIFRAFDDIGFLRHLMIRRPVRFERSIELPMKEACSKRAEAIVVREKEKKKKKRIKTWLILKRNIPRWNILPFPPSPPPPSPVQNLKINSIFCFNTVPNYLGKSFFSRRVSRKFSNYESWKLKVSRHKKRKVFQGRPSISRFPRLRKKKKKRRR